MIRICAFVLLLVLAVPAAHGQNLLFLNKSQGFEHSPIKLLEDGTTHAGKVMQELCNLYGVSLTETKNGSVINAENLKNYDLVIFYTSGDLTKPSNDGGDAMGPEGKAELLDWIRNGGNFMGFHAATDTFRTPPDGEVSPYIEMIGAEFLTHGRQFTGTVKVVDSGHPAMASIPNNWKIHEEWYLFKNFNKDTMRVLALLDPEDEREKQEMYDIPNYPIIWVSEYGEGKVYYSALGHGEEMWDNDIFRQSIVDAAQWLLEGHAASIDVKPNFEEVVPTEK